MLYHGRIHLHQTNANVRDLRSIPTYIINQLMLWYDNKEHSPLANVINFNSLKIRIEKSENSLIILKG